MNKTRGKKIHHGGWLFLRTREVPPGCEKIRAGVSRIAAELAERFAGADGELTPSQVILIDGIAQMLGFRKLIERAAWKDGPIRPGEGGELRLAPGLGNFYIAAVNSVARSIRVLEGISKKPNGEEMTDLRAYVAKRAGQSEKNSSKAYVSQPEGRTEDQENARDKDSTV